MVKFFFLVNIKMDTKNGKVEIYYKNGLLAFSGEYKDGKRNGIGEEYYPNGKLKYSGEYLNDQRN